MPSIDVICDASVVVKWIHHEGERDVEDARRLLAAHRSQDVSLHVLELTFYELGNVLIRSLHRPVALVVQQLDELRAAVGVIVPSAADLRAAAQLAERYTLTFYDASYAAAALSRGATLATADRALITARVGQPPREVLEQLGPAGMA